MTGAPLLSVENLIMRFGGLTAVDDVSFHAAAQKITAVIGPNGAGKTTLFNCLTGFYAPSAGALRLNHPRHGGMRLEKMESFRIARQAGVARTFQNIRLFPNMTVLENLIVARHNVLMKASAYTLAGLFLPARYARAEKQALAIAGYWLDKVGLAARADIRAGALPYGGQRRLEIARAMCIDPVLLCLDEPAAGLNPKETSDLNRLITCIRDEHGVGVLLIEHDMSVVMEISDHVVVLDYGRKIAEGAPQRVRAHPAVIRAYLGEDADDA